MFRCFQSDVVAVRNLRCITRIIILHKLKESSFMAVAAKSRNMLHIESSYCKIYKGKDCFKNFLQILNCKSTKEYCFVALDIEFE